jgi:hypothetical protein
MSYWLNMFSQSVKRYPDLIKMIPDDKQKELDELDDDYWIALQHKDMFILRNNAHLIKNAFRFNDCESESLKKLFDYLKNSPHLCVAGGYPTLQYLEKNLSDFQESDIDIFLLGLRDKEILENDDCSGYNKEAKHYFNYFVKEFVNFLDDQFTIDKITSYTDMEACVFNIHCKKLSRTIQLISTKYDTVAELLNTFDLTHCKCALYLGDTYVTPDAEYAKRYNTTFCLHTYYKPKRLNKAYNLGLTIYGMHNYTIIPVNEKNAFNFLRTKEGMLRDFISADWINKYSRDSIMYLPSFNIPADKKLPRYEKLREWGKFIPISRNTFPLNNDFAKLIEKASKKNGFHMVSPKIYPLLTTGIIDMNVKGCGIRNINNTYITNESQCTSFYIPLTNDNDTLQTLSNIDKNILETIKNFPNQFTKEGYTPLIRSDFKNQYKRISVAIKHRIDSTTGKVQLDIDLIKNGKKIHVTNLDELRHHIKNNGNKASFEIYIDKFWLTVYTHRNSLHYACHLTCKTIIL